MSEGEEERRWERPARSRGKSALITIVVLALLGAVLWLLSERNARQWFLVYEDGTLQVKKGLLLPAGRQAFKTDDPGLAQAYAPLKPPPGAKLDEERRFEDRAGLDQALYELLARWARDDVTTERPEMIERALGWIARAEKLAGVSTAQREDLRVLRAEVGFFEAKQLLERSADALRQARERLRLTASSPSTHAREADAALRRVDPLVDELYRAMREVAPSGGATRPGSAAAGPGQPDAAATGAAGTGEAAPASGGTSSAGPSTPVAPPPPSAPPPPGAK